MLNHLKERIKRDKPFSELLDINIVDIAQLREYNNSEISGRLLFYGVSFRIRDSIGRLYKLRAYSSVETAVEQESIVQLIPHILPKFYGRDRNYLVFEFLRARPIIDNESPDIFYKIGKMYGEVNSLKAGDDKKQELKEIYYQKIDCFLEQGIVSRQNHQKILGIYRKLCRNITYKVVLGFNDLNKGNFMIDLENKLYFVDEDAIEYNIKGYGLDNMIYRFYFGSPPIEFKDEYTKAFFLGYDSVNSSVFLNQGYQKLLTFLFMIDNVLYFFRTERTKDMHYELKRLLGLEW